MIGSVKIPADGCSGCEEDEEAAGAEAAAGVGFSASSPCSDCGESVFSDAFFCGRIDTGASPRSERHRLKSGAGVACSDFAKSE